MQRHHALASGLAGRDVQAGGAVRHAIEREPLDLAAPGAAPARREQRRALVGAVERTDRVHEPGQLVGWDVARDPVRWSGELVVVEQEPRGDAPHPQAAASRKN